MIVLCLAWGERDLQALSQVVAKQMGQEVFRRAAVWAAVAALQHPESNRPTGIVS